MTDTRNWFPHMDPPPGGERRLRIALQARPRLPALRWVPAAAACGVLALAVTTWPMQREQSRLDDALRAAWTVPDTPRVEHGHSRELASGEPDVRLYLVTLTAPSVPR